MPYKTSNDSSGLHFLSVRYRHGRLHRIFSGSLIGFFVSLIGIASMTLESQVALAWEPARFEVFCGAQTRDSGNTQAYYTARLGKDSDDASAPNCLSVERKELVAQYAALALGAFKSLGFASPAPHRLGPVVLDAHSNKVVRIYVDPDDTGIARTRSPCTRDGSPVKPDYLASTTFSPQKLDSLPNPTILRYISHEIVHVVQSAQPLVNHPDTDDCANIPGWLYEGTADALGLYVSQKRFPTFQPPLSVSGSRSYYGLRPYNKAFTWESGDEDIDRYGHGVYSTYRSNSFFMYLADHYYGGRYNYLGDFYAIPDLARGKDDWLVWLDAVLRNKEMGTRAPLYLVFPDFMANFANWGRDKYPHIGEEAWLTEAFDGCQTLTLSPTQPTRGLPLELEPISAQCLRVLAGGLQLGELARIKFMVYANSEEEVDNVHLAVARMSGRIPDFPEARDGCYQAAKNLRGKPLCISKPFTGRKEAGAHRGTPKQLADGTWVKTWLSNKQEVTEDLINNLYMVVHTPVHPSDRAHDNRKKQKLRLVVGLERSQLTTTTGGTARQTTASVNHNSNQPIPMKGSEKIAANGAPLGADALSKLPFLMNIGPVPETNGSGISSVSVADTQRNKNNSAESTTNLTLSVVGQPIPFGASGSFKANVIIADEQGIRSIENIDMGAAGTVAGAEALGKTIAALVGTSVMGNVNAKTPSATIEVIAFNDDLLHLRASGSYCRTADYDKSLKCRNPQDFSAEIIKPFGWAYDSKQAFVSVDTPGMALYREHLYQAIQSIPGLSLPDLPPVGSSTPLPGSSGTAAGPASIGTGVAQVPCDCSCSGMERSRQLMKEIKNAKGMDRMTPEVMTMISCSMQCMAEWSKCKRK